MAFISSHYDDVFYILHQWTTNSSILFKNLQLQIIFYFIGQLFHESLKTIHWYLQRLFYSFFQQVLSSEQHLTPEPLLEVIFHWKHSLRQLRHRRRTQRIDTISLLQQQLNRGLETSSIWWLRKAVMPSYSVSLYSNSLKKELWQKGRQP